MASIEKPRWSHLLLLRDSSAVGNFLFHRDFVPRNADEVRKAFILLKVSCLAGLEVLMVVIWLLHWYLLLSSLMTRLLLSKISKNIRYSTMKLLASWCISNTIYIFYLSFSHLRVAFESYGNTFSFSDKCQAFKKLEAKLAINKNPWFLPDWYESWSLLPTDDVTKFHRNRAKIVYFFNHCQLFSPSLKSLSTVSMQLAAINF